MNSSRMPSWIHGARHSHAGAEQPQHSRHAWRRRWHAAVVGILVVASPVLPKAIPTAARAEAGAPAWVDQDVTFSAGGMTIYGTYRHATGSTAKAPAVLLIAGSGPTDRNGNTPLENGPVNTLKTLAYWLSADGVASLRYDKLGSGQTGLGPWATRLDDVGIAPFEQEAVAGLRFLDDQPQTAPGRLAVFGHSEGALFALLVASGAAGPAPAIHAVGLFEPLSLRYLTLIADQIQGQVEAAIGAGEMTAAQGAALETEVNLIVKDLRTEGKLPPNVPSDLASLFNASTSLFLSQADRYDPASLAARLASGTPALVTCSNADAEVTCVEVDHLVGGLRVSHAATDFVHLAGVDHVLKQDPTGTNYTAELPFSPQLKAALALFVSKTLVS